MSLNLKVLNRYFSNGSAENEDFLSEVYVENRNLERIVMPPSKTITLLVGSKGSGKSAVLHYWNSLCAENQIPAILLDPELMEVDSCDETDYRQWTQNIYKALVHEICVKVGSELKGYMTEAQKKLVDDAVKAGVRQPTGMDIALKALIPIGKVVSDIDFGEMLPSSSGTTRANIITLNSTFKSKNMPIFYVLIDDIDKFGNAGSSSYINRIWSAVSAFRKLVQQLPNVRAIASFRSEIWRQIQNRTDNGRDQVDHVRGWVVDLSPSESDMAKILRKRLERCKVDVEDLTQVQHTNVFEPFFEGDRCNLPTSGKKRSWETYIIKSSRDRPRDAMQLISLMAEDAEIHNFDKIRSSNVANTSLRYSEQRVFDLCKENMDLCPDLEKVVRSFGSINNLPSVDFILDADVIRKHLLKLPSTGMIVQGRSLQPGNEEDMFALWNLLHRLGFINARVRDANGTDGYRHIQYSNDQTLVSKSRWNEMQSYQWEIHPCYRSFLFKRVKDREAMDIQRKLDKADSDGNQNVHNNRGRKKKRPKTHK